MRRAESSIFETIASGTSIEASAGQEEVAEERGGGDVFGNPEHDCRDVAVGVHAPPLFAAIITTLAKSHLSLLSPTSFLSSIVITIAVVRLSSTADMKKVMKAKIQRSLRLFEVVILSVITENPPWTSISSTIVIAPMR